MDEYYSVIQFLPEPLRTELKAMPPERAACVQEIRLRAGQAVQFTVGGAWQPAQQLLPAAQTALAIGPRMLRSCFAALCRDSAYAYEDELKQGYFTLPGGSRVGVAGVCGPAGFADITSLNLRVARQVPCVLPPQLRRTLDALNGGILVVGTPGSGKTTFLRSIIRYLDTARRIFCVADERGELLTMEEFFEAWTKWKNEKYHTREHRGLKDAGEKWITPISLFENGERYEKAAPPREYAAMLLMKADTARVTNQGINKFGTLYTDYELCHYVGKHVGIKWDIDDVTKLYVFDQEGWKICEAVSAELLAFGPHCSQAALERHLRDQKRQEKEMREILDSMTRPYELRVQEGGRPSEAVGMIDLTIKADRPSKLISLPNDKEFRAEMATNRKTGKKASGDEFLGKKADDALARLRAMNE